MTEIVLPKVPTISQEGQAQDERSESEVDYKEKSVQYL